MYTLDACDWPLILNRGDDVVAAFPLPKGSVGDDAAGLQQLKLANACATVLAAESTRPGRIDALAMVNELRELFVGDDGQWMKHHNDDSARVVIEIRALLSRYGLGPA